MPDLTSVKSLKKFMALFVGANGSGKSIAIASWKKLGKVYYFDFDGRMASVYNWHSQRGLRDGQIDYDTYGPHNLYEAYQKMAAFTSNCPYSAVVLDSFTAMTISAVMFSLHQRSSKGGKDINAFSKGNMIIPDWDEWNGEAVFITQMLDFSKTLAAKGTAVFWTAHPIQRTKIEGRQYSLQTNYAAYGHKSTALLPIYFDEIYSFITDWDPPTGVNKRICHTQPHDGVNAKTALNLPSQFEWTDSDFYEILKSLADSGEEEAMKRGEQYRLDNPSYNEVTETKPVFKL